MVATRFAVAIHIMLLLACGRAGGKSTSQVLARSVNTNPVVVRRITSQLAFAGLIRVRRGPGGATLARDTACISLGHIWLAVNSRLDRPLLPLHAAPDRDCPVGREVHAILGSAFEAAEDAMQAVLHRTTLASLVQRMPALPSAEVLSNTAESCALSGKPAPDARTLDHRLPGE